MEGMATLTVRSQHKADVIDVTDRVQQVVRESGVQAGLCHVYVAHTTAGVFINENDDPDVMTDVLTTRGRTGTGMPRATPPRTSRRR